MKKNFSNYSLTVLLLSNTHSSSVIHSILFFLKKDLSGEKNIRQVLINTAQHVVSGRKDWRKEKN